MKDLIGKRVDLELCNGWRNVGTLKGSDRISGRLKWILEDCYKCIYTCEDGSGEHNWVYLGTRYILDEAIIDCGESLVDESKIKEPMGRKPSFARSE